MSEARSLSPCRPHAVPRSYRGDTPYRLGCGGRGRRGAGRRAHLRPGRRRASQPSTDPGADRRRLGLLAVNAQAKLAIYWAADGQPRPHQPDGGTNVTCDNMPKPHQTNVCRATTDQKVGGSNPSERASWPRPHCPGPNCGPGDCMLARSRCGPHMATRPAEQIRRRCRRCASCPRLRAVR